MGIASLISISCASALQNKAACKATFIRYIVFLHTIILPSASIKSMPTFISRISQNLCKTRAYTACGRGVDGPEGRRQAYRDVFTAASGTSCVSPISIFCLFSIVGLMGCDDSTQSTPPATNSQPIESAKLALCNNPESNPLRHIASTQALYPDLRLQQPVAMRQAPDNANYWYVLEQAGRIIRIETETGASRVFADLSDRVVGGAESGLLGLAFHPDFTSNRQVFIYYTRAGEPLTSILSRFQISPSADSLDISSERILLTLEQKDLHHFGGGLAFGPDGFLYLSLGDNSLEGDAYQHAQNLTTLQGSVIRIDIDRDPPYAIPADNPFVQGGGRPEIYAWGFRNPWSLSFDRKTGQLWIADVGKSNWEEVNKVDKGGNYGWSFFEGKDCLAAEREQCKRDDLIPPHVAYDHGQGCSVTGGYVYHGEILPELKNHYIYGDFCSGQIWAVATETKPQTQAIAISKAATTITSFAQDPQGELYFTGYDGSLNQLSARTQRPAPSMLYDALCTTPTVESRQLPETVERIRNNSQHIGTASGFDVYYKPASNSVNYIHSQCKQSDLQHTFFLHIYPQNLADIKHDRDHKFQNMDFNFSDYGIQLDELCIAERQLPFYTIKQIMTGQYTAESRTWQLDYVIAP